LWSINKRHRAREEGEDEHGDNGEDNSKEDEDEEVRIKTRRGGMHTHV